MGLRPLPLVLLLSFLSPALLQGISTVCYTNFKILFITSTHSWIQHGSNTSIVGGPAGYYKVGFEATNGLPIGKGGLRQETYSCTYPQPSTASQTQCARMAVQLLVERGWNDGKKAPYRIWEGAKACSQISDEGNCEPNPSGNVCWTFTCNFVECALRKLGCHNQTALSDYAFPPEDWTCSPEKYADGERCDCGCGATDPDCVLDLTLPTRGCPRQDDICLPGNECLPREAVIMSRKLLELEVNGADAWDRGYLPRFAPPFDPDHPIRSVEGWTCPVSYYGTNDGCDAWCGIQDPDCIHCGNHDPHCVQRYTDWYGDSYSNAVNFVAMSAINKMVGKPHTWKTNDYRTL